MTLLSCLAANSIALPLSPAFPAHELQYILDHSEAAILLSSAKFEGKAQEVLREKLKKVPNYIKLEKKMGGGAHPRVTLEGPEDGEGGMMLYTSGTTNRPVCPFHLTEFPKWKWKWLIMNPERRPPPAISNDSTSTVPSHSLELHSIRPPPSRPPTASYPWNHKRHLRASFCWVFNRVPLSLQRNRSLGTLRCAFPTFPNSQF